MDFGIWTSAGRAARVAKRVAARAPASVGEIMVQRVPWITSELTVGEILRFLHRAAVDPRALSHLYVLNEQGVVCGMVSLRTLLSERSHVRAGDVMCNRPATVGTGATAEEATRTMRERRIGVLPVVDEAGRPVGAVVLEDALRSILRGEDTDSGSYVGPEKGGHAPDTQLLEGARAGAARFLVAATAAMRKQGPTH